MQNWLDLSKYGINFKKAVMPSSLTFPILIIEDIEKYNNSGAVNISELTKNSDFGISRLGGDKKGRNQNTPIFYISKSLKNKSGEFEIIKTLSKILNRSEAEISNSRIKVSDNSHVMQSPFANIEAFNNKCKNSSNNFYGHSLFIVKEEKSPINLIDLSQELLNSQHSLFPKNNIENISFHTLDSFGYDSSIVKRVFTDPDDALKQGFFLSDLEEINLKADKSVLPVSINSDRSINVIFDIEKLDALNYTSPTWDRNFSLIEDFNSIKSLQESCKHVLNARLKNITNTNEMADHLENVSNVLQNIHQSQRSIKHFKPINYNNEGINIFLLKNKDNEWRYIEKNGFKKNDQPLNILNYNKILEKLAHSNNVLLAAMDQQIFSPEKLDSSLKVVFKNHSELFKKFTTNEPDSNDKIFLNQSGIKIHHQVFERNLREFDHEIGLNLNNELTRKRLNELHETNEPYLNINQTGEYLDFKALEKNVIHHADSEIYDDIFDIYEKNQAPTPLNSKPIFEKKFTNLPLGINETIDKNYTEVKEIFDAIQYINFYSKPKLAALIETLPSDKEALVNSLEREQLKLNILKYQIEKYFKNDESTYGYLAFDHDNDGKYKAFDSKAAYELASISASKEIYAKYQHVNFENKLMQKLENFVNEFQGMDIKTAEITSQYLSSKIVTNEDSFTKSPLPKNINNSFYSDVIDTISGNLKNNDMDDLILSMNQDIEKFEKATRLPFTSFEIKQDKQNRLLSLQGINHILDIASAQTGIDVNQVKSRIYNELLKEQSSQPKLRDISGEFLIANFTQNSRKINLETESYFLNQNNLKLEIHNKIQKNDELLKVNSVTFESAKKEAFPTYQAIRVGEILGVSKKEMLSIISKIESNQNSIFNISSFEVSKNNIGDIQVKKENDNFKVFHRDEVIGKYQGLNGLIIKNKLDISKSLLDLKSDNDLANNIKNFDYYVTNQKYLSPTADEYYFINKNTNNSALEMANHAVKIFNQEDLKNYDGSFVVLTSVPKHINDPLYSRIIPQIWATESDQILNLHPIQVVNKDDVYAAINENMNFGSSGISSQKLINTFEERKHLMLEDGKNILTENEFLIDLAKRNYLKLVEEKDSTTFSKLNEFKIGFSLSENNIPTLHLMDRKTPIEKDEYLLFDINREDLTNDQDMNNFASFVPLVEAALNQSRFSFKDYIDNAHKEINFPELNNHIDSFGGDFSRNNVEKIYSETLHKLVKEHVADETYLVLSNDNHLPRIALSEKPTALSIKIDEVSSFQDSEYIIQGLMQRLNITNDKNIIESSKNISLSNVNESSLKIIHQHFINEILNNSLHDLNYEGAKNLLESSNLYAYKDASGVHFSISASHEKSRLLYQNNFTPITNINSNLLKNPQSSNNIQIFLESINSLDENARKIPHQKTQIVDNISNKEIINTIDFTSSLTVFKYSDIENMSYEQVRNNIRKDTIWPEYNSIQALRSKQYDFDAAILINTLHRLIPAEPLKSNRDEKIEANTFNYFIKNMHSMTGERNIDGVIGSVKKAIVSTNNFDPFFIKSDSFFSEFNNLTRVDSNNLLNNSEFRKAYEKTLIEIAKELPNNDFIYRLDGILSKTELKNDFNELIIKHSFGEEVGLNLGSDAKANSKISQHTLNQIKIISLPEIKNENTSNTLANWDVSIAIPDYRKNETPLIMDEITKTLMSVSSQFGDTAIVRGANFSDNPSNKSSFPLPVIGGDYKPLFLNKLIENSVNNAISKEMKALSKEEFQLFSAQRALTDQGVADWLVNSGIEPKTNEMKDLLSIYNIVKGDPTNIKLESVILANADFNFNEALNSFKRSTISYDSYDDDMRGRTYVAENFVSSQLDSLLDKQNKYLNELNTKFLRAKHEDVNDSIHLLKLFSDQYVKLSNAKISFGEGTIKSYMERHNMDLNDRSVISELTQLSKDSHLIIKAENVLVENAKKSFVEGVYKNLNEEIKENKDFILELNSKLGINIGTTETDLNSNLGKYIKKEYLRSEVFFEEKPPLLIADIVQSALYEATLQSNNNIEVLKESELILKAPETSKLLLSTNPENKLRNDSHHENKDEYRQINSPYNSL
ncbi:hypothetical protein OFK41_13445 [Acinetobacter baumannii]|uniref:hypothetical protein n=1 Tax=Acinetobacter baumannii TaxID=470 RepID=UPI00225B0596|nr:hypothetical protein [Acinetobacter baumannii]MCX3035207.1 hypothetical protein [Acinetobacter baumannii]